ncbi:hypothetical protein ABFT80_08130 [Mesorhizobium sp. SB112]|uniref:hypothetical protein n=1 Tax=Mesorhizobium sp. SB112 TaxID=3151853 RepID=UPI0032635DD5
MAPDRSDLVTVGRAYGQMEAGLAFSLLDSAAIPVVAQTRQTASVAWNYMFGLGGIAILVPRSDSEAALALLSDFKPMRPRPGVWRLLLAVIIYLFFGVPPPPSGYFAVSAPAVSRKET